ncbi:MAG: hypothetical protein ABEJ92_01320 [Halobacteriales archaeon]
MGRYGDLDYGRYAKGGFLLGVGLLVLGAGGELAIHALGIRAPGWEDALLFDLEVIGVALFLFAPLVFGVLLPLTE